MSRIPKMLPILRFTREPSFADLWDACVYTLLYDSGSYTEELEALFVEKHISKKSKIIDVSCGGGFLALHLVQDGYNVDCIDASSKKIIIEF